MAQNRENGANNVGHAILLGRLLRSYREDTAHGGGRLSQDGLLNLLSAHNPSAGNYDRSTLSNWERGKRAIPHEFLLNFGSTLKLEIEEIDGLLVLAGYEPYFDPAQQDDGAPAPDPDDVSPQDIAAVLDGIRRDVHILATEPARRDKDTDAPSSLPAVAGNALRRAALPAVYIAAVGYALVLAGVGDAWALMAFVAIALCLPLALGLLRWRWANPIGEMFFISLLFLHSALALQVALLNMDPYGFYTVAGFAGTPFPILLALLAGLALALAAAVMFDLLWGWQYGPRGSRSAYARALWVVFPPLLFTYGNLVVFGNYGSWLYNLMSLGILGGCFATITALKDPAVRPSEWDRRIMLTAAIQAVIILATMSALGMLFAYLEPNMMAVPDHTLLRSWEIDFSALGYPEAEFRERLRLGNLWMNLAGLAYMTIAVGGYLLATIYRIGASPNSPSRRIPVEG